MAKRNFLFDYDSTFIQVESLDTLLAYVAARQPDAAQTMQELTKLTQLSMQGQFSFHESLKIRVSAFPLHKKDIEVVVKELQTKVTPSFVRNKTFFQKHAQDIYIISGGFIELIWPVVKSFGILYQNIYANRFMYDFEGNILNFDPDRVTAHDQGKAMQVKQLQLEGDVVVIGDGFTDYEIRTTGLAQSFFAFNENVQRSTITENADAVLETLEDLFFICNLDQPKKVPRKKALLLENIHPCVADHLSTQGFNVQTLPSSLAHHELIEALQDTHILGVRSKTVLTHELLEQAPLLEAIGAFCIGTNHIDLKTCQRQGIAVFNAPFSNTRSVVEMAIAEIIILLRKLGEQNSKMHQGVWEKNCESCFEVRGKTLGIIGYGNIGAQLSVLAENLGMRVVFYDIVEKLPLGNAKACDSLQSCLQQADIVTIHVDGRPENTHLFNKETLKKMKPGSYLMNLSRGDVLDLAALEHCLQSKHLLGAALDVYPEEPEASSAPFTFSLQNYPNVMLTPHIGGSTQEAQENIGRFVLSRLQEYMELGSTLGCLNLPQLQLPGIQGSHRIIHMHRNVPGILAQINSILAQHDVNVMGQYLKTNEDIGYVITDTNVLNGESFLKEFERIEHTIRLRILY